MEVKNNEEQKRENNREEFDLKSYHLKTKLVFMTLAYKNGS